MGESYLGSDTPNIELYLEIDEKIKPGEAGTNLEGALAAQLEGITDRVINWRTRSFGAQMDRDWDPYFNQQVCREWDNLIKTAHNQSFRIEFSLCFSEETIYGRLLRWEKYRQNFALYDEVPLPPTAKLDIAYVGKHMVHGRGRHDRPLRDSDLEQTFIGDPSAGYQEDYIVSGIAISMNQLALSLQSGSLLRVKPEA